MKILIAGYFQTAYEPDRFVTACSCEGRELGMTYALAELGHTVDLTGAVPRDLGLNTRVVCWDTVKSEDYDVILIQGANQVPPEFMKFDQHPFLVGWVDRIHFDDAGQGDTLTKFKLLIANSTLHVAEGRRRWPELDVRFLPWAVPEVASLPSPWSDDADRIVFCGVITQPRIDVFNAFVARGYSVWVGGYYGATVQNFTQAERAVLFDPRVSFLSDVIPDERDRDHPHGWMRYGSQFAAYQHARVGLNFCGVGGRLYMISSKIYDYVGCGLSVVTEDSCLNAGDVLNLDAGRVVPEGDTGAMIAAVESVLRRPRASERVKIKREALAFGTWRDRARTISCWLSELQSVR